MTMVASNGVSQKVVIAKEIAAFLVGRYVLTATPRVLMWREIVCEYSEGRKLTPPDWIRDCDDVHRHYDKYGKLVRRVLREEYGITAIGVSRQVRELLKHGDSPERDDRRNDAWYRGCIPSASNPTMGIVTFPRDTFANHPLIVKTHERRVSASASGLANALGAADQDETSGVLTHEAKVAIVGAVVPSITEAVDKSVTQTLCIAPPAE